MTPPVYSDAARRMADAMTLHTIAGNAGMWAAFRLDDGRERHPYTAFASWRDAVRSCGWDRDFTTYLFITPDGMQPKEAEAWLTYTRQLHDAGFRLPDPDDIIQPDITMPLLPADRARQIKLLTGKR